MLKNWCFWIVVLEKTLESPLDCMEIKPINPKENQPWIFTRRTDDETPILWPPDSNNWLIGQDLDAAKDWGAGREVVTEDEMGGRHHQLNGCEFEQSPGDSEGQGSLVSCSPWGHKQSDTTEQLNNHHPVRPCYFSQLKVSLFRDRPGDPSSGYEATALQKLGEETTGKWYLCS